MKNQSISPDQCRAARAFLNWSQPELAERCALTVNPILNFEKGGDANAAKRTMDKIVRAFVLAGMVFTPTGGVERKNTLITVLEGENANRQLLEDIYHTLKDKVRKDKAGKNSPCEVLIAGLAEPGDENKSLRNFIAAHIQRLQDANITERILIEEGDTNLIAPTQWYRWLSGRDFCSTPFQLYGDKLAMIAWGPPQQITILQHPLYAQTFRNLFEQLWQVSKPVEMTGGKS